MKETFWKKNPMKESKLILISNLHDLVRTADRRIDLPKGDSANSSYDFYTVTQSIDDTILSYRSIFLREIYWSFTKRPGIEDERKCRG